MPNRSCNHFSKSALFSLQLEAIPLFISEVTSAARDLQRVRPNGTPHKSPVLPEKKLVPRPCFTTLHVTSNTFRIALMSFFELVRDKGALGPLLAGMVRYSGSAFLDLLAASSLVQRFALSNSEQICRLAWNITCTNPV